MKFDPQKDVKRILFIIIASFIMALNIKTFVHTGGLYPGGATGLTILIQSIGTNFFNIEVPYTLVNLLLKIQLHQAIKTLPCQQLKQQKIPLIYLLILKILMVRLYFIHLIQIHIIFTMMN